MSVPRSVTARAWRSWKLRSEALAEAIAALHRASFGRLVASLLRQMRGLCLSDAEGFVQEAFARALERWEDEGVPRNPEGWLARVARNAALDAVRSRRTRERLQDSASEAAPFAPEDSEASSRAALAGEVSDEVLALAFACCHPSLAEPARVSLTLKIVFGLTTREIAAAQLANETAIAQRIVRAQARLREEGEAFAIPAGPELDARLDSVLRVLFLLFNEGYFSGSDEGLLRRHLCEEALRLAHRLCAHPRCARPKAFALRALFSLHMARFDARFDANGGALLLEEQDRAAWDARAIDAGLLDLARSSQGDELTIYHVHAAISAAHSVAPRFEDTDWEQVRGLYDLLLSLEASPLTALARTVATSHLEGPEAALAEWERLPREALAGSFLYHAAHGDYLARAGRGAEAETAFDRAESLVEGSAQAFAVRKRRLRNLKT